jgi:hypothetical protein
MELDPEDAIKCIETVVFPYGKHLNKDIKTVAKIDPNYLVWTSVLTNEISDLLKYRDKVRRKHGEPYDSP